MTGPAGASDDSRSSWLPPHWRELAPIVDAVLDTPPELRAGILADLCGGRADWQAMVAELVAECERDRPLMNAAAAERFDDLRDEPDPAPPAMLGDRYQTGPEVGRGGMARVFRARDTRHSRDVAIKIIRPDLAASLGRERFLLEIDIAARLRHPNIVPVYDSGSAGALLYFVMPFENGPSLRQLLQPGVGMPLAPALRALRDVARALAYAHDQGVVHRDVKPDNVLMSEGTAVVTDFGIATAVTAARAPVATGGGTQRHAASGTPAYIAPEQARGDPATDHRADIYSFGCLAYEMFEGRTPHGRTSDAGISHAPARVSFTRSDVPSNVAALIAQCLEPDPAARPQSAHDVLAVLDDMPSGAPATRPFVRSPVLAIAALALVGVLAGTLLWNANRAVLGDAPRSAAEILRLATADGSGKSSLTRLQTTPDAKVAYLVGLQDFFRGQEAFDLSVQRLERAIAEDPRFAPASAALAYVFMFGVDYGLLPLNEACDRARPAIRTALQLDATLGLAHLARARVLQLCDWNWREAEAAYQRAIALEPSATAYYSYGWLLEWYLGRAQDGVAMGDTAVALDPGSMVAHLALAWRLRGADQLDRAEEEARLALAMDSTVIDGHMVLAEVFLRRGDFAGAEREVSWIKARAGHPPSNLTALGEILARTGRTDEAREYARTLRDSRPVTGPARVAIARTQMALGQHNDALTTLEAAVRDRVFTIPFQPYWDPIRNEPRFQAMLRTLGLF